MGTALDPLRPGISLGLCYFPVYVKVESMYERAGGVDSAEAVTLSYELNCGGW